jgi:putative transposase
MSLRFVFLLITRIAAWLRLSRREEAWKTAEILILRHQFAVLQRQQPHRPKLSWADRALTATLLSVIPRRGATGCGYWSPRTRSCAGTVTSSAAAGPPGPCTARPVARPLAGTSRPWFADWPGKIPDGVSQNPRRNGRTVVKVAASTVWEILKASGIDPARRTGLIWSQFLRSRAWRATFSRPTCSTVPRLMP